MTNNMQHALDEQVHGNRIFDGGNNEDVDVNAGGGAPMPSAVYAEAMTHNEHYTYRWCTRPKKVVPVCVQSTK